MSSLEKLFGYGNKYKMEKVMIGCSNVNSMTFKIGISDKIPKCYSNGNATALLPQKVYGEPED